MFVCPWRIFIDLLRYERFTLLAALRADPNARWCPNPFCNNGIKVHKHINIIAPHSCSLFPIFPFTNFFFQHNPDTMPWVNCNACKFEFCFHCMAERHDGAACGEEALTYLQKKQYTSLLLITPLFLPPASLLLPSLSSLIITYSESELAATAQFDEWASLMKALVKPCPGCKAFIEKNDGCNVFILSSPLPFFLFLFLAPSIISPSASPHTHNHWYLLLLFST